MDTVSEFVRPRQLIIVWENLLYILCHLAELEDEVILKLQICQANLVYDFFSIMSVQK